MYARKHINPIDDWKLCLKSRSRFSQLSSKDIQFELIRYQNTDWKSVNFLKLLSFS